MHVYQHHCIKFFVKYNGLFKENRFTKCSSCTHYKKALESTMDKRKRKEIEDILEQHITLVMYVSLKLCMCVHFSVFDDIPR